MCSYHEHIDIVYNFGNIVRRSTWSHTSTQFNKGKVTLSVKYASACSSVMKNSHSRYILQACTRRFSFSVSRTTFKVMVMELKLMWLNNLALPRC